MITIYTDGSSRGNPGPGGWGAILLYQDRVREIGGRETHTTNNRMELTAAINALENVEVSGDEPIEVHADSEYVVKGMTEWIHSWKIKNWRTSAKKAVLNQDLWQKLSHVSVNKNVKWVHVLGHADNNLNNRCDEIATSFADNIDPTLYNGPRSEYK